MMPLLAAFVSIGFIYLIFLAIVSEVRGPLQ